MIKNKIDGKMYIGQTKLKPEKRFSQHCAIASNTKRNLKLYNAMRKYGIDNFEFSILENDIDEDHLDEREMYFINKYNTLSNGYNHTAGGGGVRGYHHNEESRKKMGIAISNAMWKINTPERTAKIIAAQKGRMFTDEHRKHISEACMGKRFGENNPFYGKHHSDDTKLKMSQSSIKYDVQQFDSDGILMQTFNSVRDAAQFCIDSNYTDAKLSSVMYRIYYTCMGKQNHAYNYIWKYVEKDVTTNCNVDNESPHEAQDNLK